MVQHERDRACILLGERVVLFEECVDCQLQQVVRHRLERVHQVQHLDLIAALLERLLRSGEKLTFRVVDDQTRLVTRPAVQVDRREDERLALPGPGRPDDEVVDGRIIDEQLILDPSDGDTAQSVIALLPVRDATVLLFQFIERGEAGAPFLILPQIPEVQPYLAEHNHSDEQTGHDQPDQDGRRRKTHLHKQGG